MDGSVSPSKKYFTPYSNRSSPIITERYTGFLATSPKSNIIIPKTPVTIAPVPVITLKLPKYPVIARNINMNPTMKNSSATIVE